jgi:hypothetical protein
MLVDTLAPIVLYFVLYFGSGMSLTHTIYYNLCPMYVPCSFRIVKTPLREQS